MRRYEGERLYHHIPVCASLQWLRCSYSSSGVWAKIKGDLNDGHRFCEVNLFFDGANHSPSLGENTRKEPRRDINQHASQGQSENIHTTQASKATNRRKGHKKGRGKKGENY